MLTINVMWRGEKEATGDVLKALALCFQHLRLSVKSSGIKELIEHMTDDEKTTL